MWWGVMVFEFHHFCSSNIFEFPHIQRGFILNCELCQLQLSTLCCYQRNNSPQFGENSPYVVVTFGHAVVNYTLSKSQISPVSDFTVGNGHPNLPPLRCITHDNTSPIYNRFFWSPSPLRVPCGPCFFGVPLEWPINIILSPQLSPRIGLSDVS